MRVAGGGVQGPTCYLGRSACSGALLCPLVFISQIHTERYISGITQSMQADLLLLHFA